ncbi:hypothetical protein Prum_076990 [Phytohabitans rumicis]|uniref:AMP-dependent synthetase/ligase domain-containing protein n=1 Tax=Phytohabitans rumicis TaxID=1076125 RepID=A0A6V8LJ17_9ACTN|nr:hypothetical protein Prum_076990 [Phytohabitans rumicis]
MNLATDLAERARRNGWEARPAFLTSSRAWKHGEVHDLAARAATVLAACGVRPGDRVLLALPDSIGWIVAFLGAARLGATAVLVNPELPADDHAWLAADSRAALCVTRADLEQHFDRRKWMDIDWLLVAAAAAIRTGAHRSKPDTPLYIQYTSGTTGTPKGVVHCHRDPGLYHDTVGERVLDVGPTDVTLSVSRLYFAYGFGNTFAFPLYSGSAAVLTPDRPTPTASANWPPSTRSPSCTRCHPRTPPWWTMPATATSPRYAPPCRPARPCRRPSATGPPP